MKRLFAFVLLLFVSTSVYVFAQDVPQNIPLYETQGMIVFNLGEDPLDGPDIGDLPPNPTRFIASLFRRTVSVTALENVGPATVVVFDHRGDLIYYHQQPYFLNTTLQIPTDDWDDGDYTIYVSMIGHLYEGNFWLY